MQGEGRGGRGRGIHGCLLCCRVFITFVALGDHVALEGPHSALLTLTLSVAADPSYNYSSLQHLHSDPEAMTMNMNVCDVSQL